MSNVSVMHIYVILLSKNTNEAENWPYFEYQNIKLNQTPIDVVLWTTNIQFVHLFLDGINTMCRVEHIINTSEYMVLANPLVLFISVLLIFYNYQFNLHFLRKQPTLFWIEKSTFQPNTTRNGLKVYRKSCCLPK